MRITNVEDRVDEVRTKQSPILIAREFQVRSWSGDVMKSDTVSGHESRTSTFNASLHYLNNH